MNLKFRLLGAGASAMMAVASVGLHPASIASADSDTCIPGVVTCLSDVVNVSGNALITSGSCGNEVCWDGGSGTFTQSGNIACNGILSDPTELAPGCSVGGFSGSFANTVCGTGTADGSATNIKEAGDPGTTGGTANFHIQFIGGVGILTDRGGSTEQNSNTALGAPYPATYDGVVLLSPSLPGQPFLPNPLGAFFGSCVTNFNFNSIDVITEDPSQQ